MSTFKKILCLSLSVFSSLAVAQSTIRGDMISLRATTPASTCTGGKIIYSTSDSQVKICQGGTYKAVGLFTTGAISNGEILIGHGANNAYSKSTITAGAGVTITNGAGTITIASSGSAPVHNYTSQTTTYSAVIDDFIKASGNSFTITLPTAVGNAGRSIIIEHAGSSHLDKVYTINTTSSQVIIIGGVSGGVGSGVLKLTTMGEQVILTSDGTQWMASHYTDTGPVSYTPDISAGQGTESNVNVFWQRYGRMARIWGSWTSGTPAASLVTVALPTGMTITTTYMPINATTANPCSFVGHLRSTSGIHADANLVACTSTSTSLLYASTSYSASAAQFTPANGNASGTLFANTAVVQFDVWIPVTDWLQ